MATMLQKARNKAAAKGTSGFPKVVKSNYTSLPVDIPEDFLAPLSDPSTISVNQIDFATSVLPEYKGLYAVVLDNVMNEQECKQLLHMTELSAGGHSEDATIEDDGWRPAMVNAGRDKEFLALDYRNSDRIIWDNEVIVQRLWTRIMQAEGMRDYFGVMKGKGYSNVVGDGMVKRNERWVVSPKGPNERMRFLKYGAGQFFRRKSSLPST
jgi:hypothetical protein